MRYEPAMREAAARLIARARKKNAEFDAIDLRNGMAMPRQCGVTHQLQTVITALAAGMSTASWDCVAEAFCMLQDAEVSLREGQS